MRTFPKTQAEKAQFFAEQKAARAAAPMLMSVSEENTVNHRARIEATLADFKNIMQSKLSNQ